MTISCLLSCSRQQDQQLGELNDGYIEVDFDATRHDEYDQTPIKPDSSEKPGTELANSNVDELQEHNKATQLSSEYLCISNRVNGTAYMNMGVMV